MGQSMTAPGGRLDHLDAIRGVAVLGIALMNVEAFTMPLTEMAAGVQPGQRPLDAVIDWLVYVLVQGKFWTLFSLLFGMGFVLMLDRARTAGTGFVPLYLRRTAGLLVIGLAHALLVWGGDILVSYALGGFALLLLFRDADAARMRAWGAGLWIAMIAFMLLGAAMLALPGTQPEPVDSTFHALGMREAAAYSSGSYAEVTATRVAYFLATLGNQVFLLPLLVGTFLLGGWLVRSGLALDPARHRHALVRLAWIAGGTGLVATLASVLLTPNPEMMPVPSATVMAAASLHLAGGMMLALGYAAGLLLLAGSAGRLRVFGPVGRMALSNYLLQSVAGTLLFYGYGFALWGQVSRTAQVLGVLAFFALQVLASHWWLARFRQGPVEWLWRAFTYWRLPRLRRDRDTGASGRA